MGCKVVIIRKASNSYWRERLCTVDLLINIYCFVKMKEAALKAADLK
jgi:hypothetical protein